MGKKRVEQSQWEARAVRKERTEQQHRIKTSKTANKGGGGEEEKGADRASPSTGKAGGIGRDSRAGQCREED